jgi:hypothetical protein
VAYLFADVFVSEFKDFSVKDAKPESESQPAVAKK